MAPEILVGYDGSDDAAAALDWALRESTTRHVGIRVLFVAPDVTAVTAAAAGMAGVAVAPVDVDVDTTGLFERAAERAKEYGVEVVTESVTGAPARELVQWSKNTELLVIGARGMGAAASLVMGSSVIHVTAHAHCPVVVAQAPGLLDGPVVVGVDSSAASQEPLAWAFDHASRHGLPLEVVHAYAIPVYPGVVPYVPPVEITVATSEFEDRVAHEVLAGWSERYPDVQVTTTVVHDRPGPVLVAATERASVTVVGTRGRGPLLGMLLGSTSQAVLHHAKGTVVVVPPGAHHEH